MYLPDVEVHEPHSLAQASALLSEHGASARVLAGGTDVLVDLKTARTRASHLVSIQRIEELRGVHPWDGGIRIGAGTTINELIASPLVRDAFPPILEAARQMAAPQVRALATVGGNLASAVPCADLPPILLVLGASVEIYSGGQRKTLPLDAFFTGPRRTVLAPRDLLTAVLVPPMGTGFGAAYARFALREGNAIAVASVAASLRIKEKNIISEARIALGAVAPVPLLARQAANLLVDRPAEADAFDAAAMLAMRAATPISDIRGSAGFRREIVGVLARRALNTAHLRAKETLR